jgi:hypothetical protein
MSTETPLREQIERAAELRAAGTSWPTVATTLQQNVNAIRQWPSIYSTEWTAAHQDAEKRQLAEACAESILILRQLLRSDNDKIRCQSARFLLEQRLALTKLQQQAHPSTAPFTSEAAQLVAFLEGHTHEQLAEIVAATERPAQHLQDEAVPEPVAGAD